MTVASFFGSKNESHHVRFIHGQEMQDIVDLRISNGVLNILVCEEFLLISYIDPILTEDTA